MKVITTCSGHVLGLRNWSRYRDMASQPNRSSFSASAPQASTAAYKAANILLVEDDDDLADLVQMHLKFQGHQVTRVSLCGEARQHCSAQPFDLVILDRVCRMVTASMYATRCDGRRLDASAYVDCTRQ